MLENHMVMNNFDEEEEETCFCEECGEETIADGGACLECGAFILTKEERRIAFEEDKARYEKDDE